MAKDKKSFILYCDQKGLWDKLNNEQAGKLIKHILAYVNDENPTTDDFITELAFEPIKQQLKRDLKNWENQYVQRVEAGRKSAEVRKRNATTVDERLISSTVNGNVNVNGTVNGNVNANVKDILKDDENYVTVSNEKVTHEKVLEFYEAQLNGTQSEYSLPAWKPLVNSWFLEHLQENFKDNDHLKNSFKKWYINRKPKTTFQKERTKLL